MNILLLRNAENTIGGAEIYVSQLAQILRASKNKVVVSSSIRELRSRVRATGGKAAWAPWIRNSFGPKTFLQLIIMLPIWTIYYMFLIKKNKIDIVNCNSRDDFILLSIMKPLHRKKVVLTDHGDMKHQLVLAHSSRYMGRIYAWAIHRADSIIFVAKAERNHVRKLLDGYKIAHGRLDILPNGLLLDTYNLSAQKAVIPYDQGGTVIGVICNLFPAKGVSTLLETVAQLVKVEPTLQCVVVGSGIEGDNLKDQASKLGIADCVYFAGYQNKVAAFLNKIDIFVLPTDYEAAPISVLEAMYFGKPVVAYAVGGIVEQVADKETGLLVKHGDKEGLIKAVRSLLSDPDLMSKMGKNAHQRIMQYFNATKIINESYLPLLNELLGGKQ